jgi:simple sugar transport system permease protein
MATHSAEIVAAPERESFGAVAARHAPVISIAVLLIAVLIGFGSTTDHFLTSDNLLNVLRQSAPAVVVGVAATLVISSAGIDLSVGSLVAFTGTSAALFLRDGLDPIVVLPLVLLLGAAVGAVSGWFVAYQGLPAFIVTLAGLSVLAGGAQVEAKGFTIGIEQQSWLVDLGQGKFAGIPNAAIVAGVVALVGWVILARTAYGRHLQGIGSNEEAVRRAGVRTKRVIASVYAISGFASALAGLLVATRLQSGSASIGTGLELQVIAAVVLGGTSLFGGRGTILGTILGVLTIALISNGLILRRVEPFYVSMVQGAILLLAVWANERVFARWLRSAT